MKKLFAALILISVLLLSACNAKTEGNEEKNTSENASVTTSQEQSETSSASELTTAAPESDEGEKIPFEAQNGADSKNGKTNGKTNGNDDSETDKNGKSDKSDSTDDTSSGEFEMPAIPIN